MYLIEEIEHAGMTIKIYPDDDPCNPRENFEYNSTFFFVHNRYSLGDVERTKELEDATDECSSWSKVAQYLRKFEDAKVIIPVWMIDHSGIALRAGRDFGDCDPGGWDSGILGLAFQTGDDLREQYGVKRITKKVLDQARENLTLEVEEYSTYVEGGVVGFVVEDPKGESHESCWGFYDMESCISEAKSAAEYEAKRISDETNTYWLNAMKQMFGVPCLAA